MKSLSAGWFAVFAFGQISLVDGQIWAPTSAPIGPWDHIVSSADGNRLAAIFHNGTVVYVSTNSGSSWNLATNGLPAESWTAITSSADGNKLVIGSQGDDFVIYTSTNGGVTWNYSTNTPLGYWWSISCSDDGAKLVAVQRSSDDPQAMGPGYVFASTNSGATWGRSANSPVDYWDAVASSSDGSVLVAATYYSGRIYVSTNSGMDWTLSASHPLETLSALTCSADGSTIAAAPLQVGSVFGMLVSTNSGATWVTNLDNSWYRVTSASTDGHKLVAAADDHRIYLSTNFGVSWVPVTAPAATWTSIASSTDGSQMAATILNGGIYTYPAAPSLKIGYAGTDLFVSWASYVDGYALQQNPDLAISNWTDVIATPIITNGEKRVTIVPDGQSFYRLKAY